MLLRSAHRTAKVLATTSNVASRFSSSSLTQAIKVAPKAQVAAGGLFEQSYRGSTLASTLASEPLVTLSTSTRWFSSSGPLRQKDDPDPSSLERRILLANAKKAEEEANAAAAVAAEAPRRAAAEASKAEEDAKKAEEDAKKAAADVKKAEEDAKKAAEDAKAAKEDRERKKAEDERKKYKRYAIGGIALVLLGDWMWRSNRWVQRQKIKRRMRKGPDDALLPPVIPEQARLPVEDLDLTKIKQPWRLLGPSGSGKSARLAKAARAYRDRGVPVLYFRFRGPGAGEEGDIEMSVMAQRVFESIGYPVSPSVIEHILSLASSIEFSTSGVKIQFNSLAASRLRKAFADIVAVAVELEKERKDILDDDRRKPIIFADEVHELLRNTKYGKAVFDAYNTALIDNITDMKHFRSVTAKSGGDSGDTEGKSNRVTETFQKEVPEPAVREKLQHLGYPTADVDIIVDVCGGRLRLLEPFLGPVVLDSATVKAMTNARVTDARANIDLLKERDLTGEHVEVMRDLLDKIAAGEPVNRSDVPLIFKAPFPKLVLYLGEGNRIFFQSSAVRKAWAEQRVKWKVQKSLPANKK